MSVGPRSLSNPASTLKLLPSGPIATNDVRFAVRRGVKHMCSNPWRFIRDSAWRLIHIRKEPARVLVVADDDPTRVFVEEAVRSAGYLTTMASSGLEAIELASNGQSFDLLVTNVVVPQMSGIELARRLRMKEPGLKILYLTGDSDWLFDHNALLEGEAFLDTPCSVQGLREAVSLLLFGRLGVTWRQRGRRPQFAGFV